MKFRPLKAEEIDVRVGSVGAKGASLLLYKDARCDMNILDETLGSENWQREHKELKGNIYCGVGVWDNDKNQWIWKWDAGAESFTEKEKGEASDSFKRACVNIGIGRELYTSPFIFVKCDTVKDGRGYKLDDKYFFSDARVSEIEYSETETTRTISRLVISNRAKTVFTWSLGQKSEAPKPPKKTDKIGDGGVDYLENLIIDTKADKAELLGYYHVDSLYDLTMEQFEGATKILEKRLKDGRA